MHIAAVGHENAMVEPFWSGIPFNVVHALRDAGHSVTCLGPLLPSVTLGGRIKGRVHRHLAGKTYLINRDPAIFRRRAPHAAELLAKCGPVDAVITLYPPDAAYLQSAAPVILIHDATWHQLLDFYPGYERARLAGETQSGGEALERLALANCDGVVYASHWAARDAVGWYGVDPDKIRVAPFGANLRTAPDAGDVERWRQQRGGGPCRLLFVGIDWRRKGGSMAVAAALELHRRGLPVELDIVGPPALPDLPDFVRSHGFLLRGNPADARLLNELYAGADFFILPSRAECYGIVLCEAAAFGLPTVTANTGGIPEIIGRGDWGVALPRDASPTDYADWIAAAYADRSRYQSLSRAARRDYDDRLNWRAFCRQVTDLIGDLRHDPRATPRPRMTS